MDLKSKEFEDGRENFKEELIEAIRKHMNPVKPSNIFVRDLLIELGIK